MTLSPNLGLMVNTDKILIFCIEKSAYNRKTSPNVQFHKNFTLKPI